ncbi:hypothetical protein LguiB_033767 [Lonicera macranthoides]
MSTAIVTVSPRYTTSDTTLPHQPHPPQLSRYESQKRRDWNTFCQYLKNHRPPLTLSRLSGAHVLEFLRYLDQFGKTKVHSTTCPFYGHPHPPAPCPCPLRQAWGSLDALVGRLRAAFDENGVGPPETNPFGARAVRLYLREVRDSQAKARGIAYEKKKRKKPQQQNEREYSNELNSNSKILNLGWNNNNNNKLVAVGGNDEDDEFVGRDDDVVGGEGEGNDLGMVGSSTSEGRMKKMVMYE